MLKLQDEVGHGDENEGAGAEAQAQGDVEVPDAGEEGAEKDARGGIDEGGDDVEEELPPGSPRAQAHGDGGEAAGDLVEDDGEGDDGPHGAPSGEAQGDDEAVGEAMGGEGAQGQGPEGLHQARLAFMGVAPPAPRMDDVALHHEEEEEAGGGGKGDGLARQALLLACNDGPGEDVQEGDAQEDPCREPQHEVEGGVGDLGRK